MLPQTKINPWIINFQILTIYIGLGMLKCVQLINHLTHLTAENFSGYIKGRRQLPSPIPTAAQQKQCEIAGSSLGAGAHKESAFKPALYLYRDPACNLEC